MKKTFLALIFTASLAFAAEPVVIVNSISNVTIDGRPAGTIVDALANNPAVPNFRARLFDALLDYEKTIVAREKTRADDAIKQAQKTADATIAEEQTKARKAADAAAAAEDSRAAEAKRTADIVAALKAIPSAPALPPIVRDAMRTEDEKQRAALELQQAEIEKKISRLKNGK